VKGGTGFKVGGFVTDGFVTEDFPGDNLLTGDLVGTFDTTFFRLEMRRDDCVFDCLLDGDD
jgi:hypothetical protein